MAGVLDGAEDQHARRRGRDVDEQVIAQFRALGPHQFVRVLAGERVEHRVAEASLAGAVGPDQQARAGVIAADCGDEGGATALSGQGGEGRLRAHGS